VVNKDWSCDNNIGIGYSDSMSSEALSINFRIRGFIVKRLPIPYKEELIEEEAPLSIGSLVLLNLISFVEETCIKRKEKIFSKRVADSKFAHWVSRAWQALCRQLPIQPEEIDLSRTLSFGDLSRASLLLPDSPHATFLMQYQKLGDKILLANVFKRTAYFKNAMDCVHITGHYFGQNTFEGIQAQARSFLTLYERIKAGDGASVSFPSTFAHSSFRSLPWVRKTLTQNTVQIDDGMHRLSIAWALGHKITKAVVLPAKPTRLQSLVTSIGKSQKQLCQPIHSVEFDDSWKVLRRCQDRFDKMLTFLSEHDYQLGERSMVDVGCSYGWFVSEFAKKGCHHAYGVDRDLEALEVGQIVYGIGKEQLFGNTADEFFGQSHQTYDIVLFLSTLHHLVLKSGVQDITRTLKKIDEITGSVLFLDTAQSHESRFQNSWSEWNDDFIVALIKGNTSFAHVIPLGPDSDNVASFDKDFGRTLFACIR
jgi:SAM-dependent methyltransferase